MPYKKLLVAGVLLFFCSSTLVTAQSRPADYLEIIEIHVKPGATSGFEDYVKKIVEAAKKVGSEPHWATLQTTLGHNADRYQVIFYFNEWGAMDQWTQLSDLLSKAYGEQEAQKILAMGDQTIASVEDRVYTLLPDHSQKLDQFKGLAPHYFVVETTVKPDMATEFESYLARAKAAAEASEAAPMAIRRRSLIGPSASYVTALPLTKMGDFDAWPSPLETLTKMYGEREALHLREMRRRCIEEQDIYVLTQRPELSWWMSSPTSD
jgi:hypothetical protein